MSGKSHIQLFISVSHSCLCISFFCICSILIVIQFLSLSSVHSGVRIFISHSIVSTPLPHMTQLFFALLPITPPICPCLCLPVLPSVVLSSSLSSSARICEVNKTWVTTQPSSLSRLFQCHLLGKHFAKRRERGCPDRRGVRGVRNTGKERKEERKCWYETEVRWGGSEGRWRV